jgi:hypothetical protein
MPVMRGVPERPVICEIPVGRKASSDVPEGPVICETPVGSTSLSDVPEWWVACDVPVGRKASNEVPVGRILLSDVPERWVACDFPVERRGSNAVPVGRILLSDIPVRRVLSAVPETIVEGLVRIPVGISIMPVFELVSVPVGRSPPLASVFFSGIMLEERPMGKEVER